MKKRGARARKTTPLAARNRTRAYRSPEAAATAAAEFLETPLPTTSSPSQSPESAVFGNSTKRKKKVVASADSPVRPRHLFASSSPAPAHPPAKTLVSIADLKDLMSSRVDDLKRHVDRSHTVIVKELDASYSRLHKRYKIQNQECQKVSGEMEKEYKKISERIAESQEATMTSYGEFMADAHASTSHACKTSITKLSQSVEKSMDALRKCYGISLA